jgi:hypothetical protein
MPKTGGLCAPTLPNSRPAAFLTETGAADRARTAAGPLPSCPPHGRPAFALATAPFRRVVPAGRAPVTSKETS